MSFTWGTRFAIRRFTNLLAAAGGIVSTVFVALVPSGTWDGGPVVHALSFGRSSVKRIKETLDKFLVIVVDGELPVSILILSLGAVLMPDDGQHGARMGSGGDVGVWRSS